MSEFNIITNHQEIKIEEISYSNSNKDNNWIININNHKIVNDALIDYIEKIKGLQEEI
jgi:hypothetical protein